MANKHGGYDVPRWHSLTDHGGQRVPSHLPCCAIIWTTAGKLMNLLKMTVALTLNLSQLIDLNTNQTCARWGGKGKICQGTSNLVYLL